MAIACVTRREQPTIANGGEGGRISLNPKP